MRSRKLLGLTLRLRSLLSDGNSHTLGELYSEVALLIPPERAAWRFRSHVRSRAAQPSRFPPRTLRALDWPLRTQIETGRTWMIRDSLGQIGVSRSGPRRGFLTEFRLLGGETNGQTGGE